MKGEEGKGGKEMKIVMGKERKGKGRKRKEKI